MATLAESFLADLEDLSDDEPEAAEAGGDGEGEGADMEEDGLDDIESLNYDDLKSVAKLSSSAQYADVMGRVTAALEAPEDEAVQRTTATLEDDPTYKLLVDCNRLAVDIDNEMAVVHAFIKDKYRLKFPELESLVHHPVEYARVVERIGNEGDLTAVDLDDLMPAATIMVVTVTATTTSGRPLSPDALSKALQGCEMMAKLDADKLKIIRFVEGRMGSIAPNLSAAIGSEVAARLMGVAGGLLPLSRIPACNIQVLGAKRRHLAGLSSTAAAPHQGFIFGSAVVQSTPPPLRTKAARLVAAKTALLARVDAYGQDPSGATGGRFLEEMRRKIDKWQEPPPAKQIKPLPAPDAEVKKRRGGKRLRKMKERYGMTDMRKAANRTMFDFAKGEEEYIDGDEVVGLGVLGSKEGSGQLRVVANQSKLRLNAKQQKKYKGRLGGLASMGGAAVNGLSSSLAFTPVQGIELSNPLAGRGPESDAAKAGTESYFSERAGFRSLTAASAVRKP
ncbi:U4 U6 small nuclear ribonucleoprotein [Raphidocelis subcapitata]|uniref:U4 U6 small nuclear ribonucleoprotein n=1 Tax=Raphidocelis subcapitata TaxID=307507 RepID=A0A2V0PH82_9CHLO|nr:U4 U6 small nuclear ribonucleoprotein [Raphidocelis subcapitata]|eukprot:GBF99181.1 U4 U6 small nuclear ribonucleoprotein [Raphidocelis subcapitata]